MIVPRLSSQRLIGRDAELQELHDARRSLASGRGSVVLVGGEAGVGKTRLLTEFMRTLTSGRAPYCALGECLADAPRPFGPFRAVLSALVARSPGSLDGAARVIVRSLGALIPDSVDSALAGSRTLEKAELFAGVLRYLEAVASKRATIVVLEDLHWADEATLELLAHLAQRIAGVRLMIVATYRDDEVAVGHPLNAMLARLAREKTVRAIALEPLGEREVRTLIREALGKTHVLAPDQIRDVVAQAEGNPFFTEELLKKALERREARGDRVLPISIRALVLERVSRLERSDRIVVDYAAVFGERFDAGTLATIMGYDESEVRSAIRRLRDLNLVVEDAPGLGGFHFRHAMTRQIIYDELLAVDTRTLHEQIVRSLEAPESDAPVDLLAYHAWKGGLRGRTLDYSERAGDSALALHAAAQAATYYERALKAADDDDARIRLLGKMGEAHLQASAFEDATSACTAHSSMLVSHGRYDDAARALTRAAGEFANNGQTAKAFAIIESFIAEHDARIQDATRDHLYASLGRMATACDEFDRARSALAHVRPPEQLTPFTHQVYWLAQLFLAQHELDSAAWQRAASALREGNPGTYPLMRSQMLHSIASTAIDFAENAEAESAVDEALEIDREFAFSRASAFASSVKAGILCVQGRLSEARACIDQALGEPDMFVTRLELAVSGSPVAIALGDHALAQRCLEDDIILRVREAGMAAAASVIEGMQAALLYAQGKNDKARIVLERAIDGEQHQFAAVHLWPFAARHVDERRLSRMRSLCASHGDGVEHRVMHACATLLDAAAARRFGAEARSESAVSAVECYRALGWPLHEAMALEFAGRIDAAAALYRAAGSVADVRRFERHSARRATREARGSRLSPREREVANLVAQGLGNRAIADALCVGEKTIEKYVSAIYAKLNFSTRAQLAAHVARGEMTG